jgi:hypothetical protein
VYERYFSQFRGTNATFVEIGVQGGGSIAMWRDYFGPGVKIVGVDISEDCRAFEGPNTHILIGDQEDREFLAQLAAFAGPIDALLDDGGHTMQQQIATFEVLFPQIKPHGVYVCEDVHTSYWPPYGGGLRAPTSFIEFMKRKVDELNGFHTWEGEITDFTHSAESVAFYDSMVVVEKAPRAAKPKQFQSANGVVIERPE